ncbi:MAG: hypothetical protein V4530_07000 [Pseudomonadota bacterium]
MTDVDPQFALSNPGPGPLLVWLEPWAEEFEVPVRSTVTLEAPGWSGECALGEMEWTPNHLVVWASARIIKVFIGGTLQDSSSAIIPVPDGLTRKILNIAFEDQPAARLGGAGASALQQASLWERVKRRWSVNHE